MAKVDYEVLDYINKKLQVNTLSKHSDIASIIEYSSIVKNPEGIILNKDIADNAFYFKHYSDTLTQLFTMFSAYAITDEESFYSYPTYFNDLIADNIEYFDIDKSKQKALQSAIKIINDKTKTSDTVISYRKKFADLISNLPINASSILDVGSGNIPYSSLELTKHFQKVHSMDNFMLSDTALKNVNITAHNAFFDQNTSVDNYDLIVGEKPCSAIEHIVKICAKSNKPYFISLCDCNLPSAIDYKKESNGRWFGWEDVLPIHDKNAKVVDNYATNLDMSIEEIQNLTNKFYHNNTTCNINPSIKNLPIKIEYVNENTWFEAEDELF